MVTKIPEPVKLMRDSYRLSPHDYNGGLWYAVIGNRSLQTFLSGLFVEEPHAGKFRYEQASCTAVSPGIHDRTSEVS